MGAKTQKMVKHRRLIPLLKRGSETILKKSKQSRPNEKPEAVAGDKRELYEREIRFAGYYGLITTCCEDLSDDEIYSRLKKIMEDRELLPSNEISTFIQRDQLYVRTEALYIRRSLCRLCCGHWLWRGSWHLSRESKA